MAAYQLQLPISKASEYGFSHIKSAEGSIKQDIKMLILTVPGEKINDPDYGCGLLTYIFNNDSPSLRAEITSIIREKVSKYLPFVNIADILFQQKDLVLLLEVKFYVGGDVNIDQITFLLNVAEE